MSNTVDATPQIIMRYTRYYTFAINALTIKTSNHVGQETAPAKGLGLQSAESPWFLKLKGKIRSGIISNRNDLEQEAGLKNLESATRVSFTEELNSDVMRLLKQEI